MLDFLLLLEILIICAAVYGLILLVKLIKGRVGIHVTYNSTDYLSELGSLEKDKTQGATGFDVRLLADKNQTIGKLVVKEEKAWVYLPRTDEAYSNDSNSFRKMGYVDPEGYIYIVRKGQQPERIGYLAQPSKPNVPTIIGERSWKDLKWTSRLNVYYGDPEGWAAEELDTVVQVDSTNGETIPDHASEEKPVSQETMENNEPVKSMSFAAKPPRRSDVVKSEVVDVPVAEPVAEEQPVEATPEAPVVASEVVAPEVAAEPEVMPEAEVVEEVASEEVVPEVVPEVAPEEITPTEAVTEEETPEEVVEVPAVETVAVPDRNAPVFEITEEGFRYNPNAEEKEYLESVKTKHADVIAQIRREMIKVEGGSFVMGVEDPEDFDPNYLKEKNEGPAHKVQLDTYCIGKFPVTQKQWTAIMGYNHSEQINEEFPVAPVNWYECSLFVCRLNELTGLKFSLPTEAQWEFAARGGNKSNGYTYAGSNIKSAVAWESQYSPLGKKKPNELGIYDMSGLVREWCSDWYALRYPEDEQYNPMGPAMPENPEDRKHVIRSPFGNETVTNRKGELPQNPQNFKSYGFRLVCEPSNEVGFKVKPVLVGHSCKAGFTNMAPKSCPITDEARAGAYALFYNKYGKNAYSETLGENPYGWKDTALLTSIVYAALFMVLYFLNVFMLQMPLLGSDIAAIFVLTAFYFVLWGVVRMIKIESVENGHSMQPFLDLMNKSLGHRFLDIFILVMAVLSAVWTFLFYDVDLIPLILAIFIGVLVNMLNKKNSNKWEVINPMTRKANAAIDEDEEEESDLIPAPEGDVRRDYNWKLDSFVGKQIKAHIAVSFVQSEVAAQRYKNPFFLEKPNLTVADYKNYVRRMLSELMNNESSLLHSKYVVQEITRLCEKNELNEIDKLQFVLDFIQESIEYELDDESRALAMPKEYIRYPDELLYDQKGDCDCKAFFAMVCYYLMGYDVILLLSRQLGHSAVAVSVKNTSLADYLNKESLDDVTIEINGRKYYYCETTTDGFLIGDISEGVNVDKFETRFEWIHTEDEEE